MKMMPMNQMKDAAVAMHSLHRGKLEIQSKVPVSNDYEMSLAYSPWVAEPCKLIALNREFVYDYTIKGNLVAVISNGTAVLGLGNIGPEAGLPVMEGKAVLFKTFGKVDAMPLCINAGSVEDV